MFQKIKKPIWGNISGEITDQTDLVDYINDQGFLTAEDLSSTLTLYPTTASSDIGGYYKLVSDISDVSYDEPAVDVPTGAISGSDQLLSSLVSAPGLIVGTPGVVNLIIVGNIRKVTGATFTDATFHFHLFKRDSLGNEVEIGISSNTEIVTESMYLQFSANLLFNDGTWTETDRIVFKFYGDKVGGGVDPTYEFQFGGSSPVRALLPVPVNVLLSGYLKTDQTTPQTITGGQPIQDTLTSSQIVATDANKKLQTLPVATYPSLTELSRVKGVTSAIQTQINSCTKKTADATQDMNNYSITKLNNLDFYPSVGGSGLRANAITDGFGITGFSLKDVNNNVDIRLFWQSLLGTAPVDGDVLTYSSSRSGGFRPKTLANYWELLTQSAALHNINNYALSSFPYSTAFGYGFEIWHTGAVGRGISTVGAKNSFGRGAGIEELTLECVTGDGTVGEFLINAGASFAEPNLPPTPEKIFIPSGFTYSLDIDVLFVAGDGSVNQFKVKAVAQNTGAVVQGVGNILTIPSGTTSTWYTDGTGGTDISAQDPNEAITTYLRLDTDSTNGYIRMYLVTSDTAFQAFADVKIVKIYNELSASSSAGGAAYTGSGFTDTNADGAYSDDGLNQNGQPSYVNGNSYTLRWGGFSYYEIVDGTNTVIYRNYSLTGQYYDTFWSLNGYIA